MSADAIWRIFSWSTRDYKQTILAAVGIGKNVLQKSPKRRHNYNYACTKSLNIGEAQEGLRISPFS